MSRMERNEQASGLRSALPVVGSDYPRAGKSGAAWLLKSNRQLARGGGAVM